MIFSLPSYYKCKFNREIIYNQAKISDIYINYKFINKQTLIKKEKADNHSYRFHEILCLPSFHNREIIHNQAIRYIYINYKLNNN